MARRYGAYYRGRSGYERAMEHIRAAQQLSQELGGTDQDVKQYFFSLNYHQLSLVLDEYESKYGQPAREYASATFNRWKSGSVQMSGMVAERLFNLLPPRMALETKYHLIENLWNHVGPSSKKTYYIGIDANLEEVKHIVRTHLEKVVTSYTIPEPMERRFKWLAGGDSALKQNLLNHLRQQNKILLTSALTTNLPVLIDHLSADKANLTKRAAQVLAVGKHQVEVVVHKKVSGITEKAPGLPMDLNWIWWVAGLAFLLWLFNN